MQAHSSGVPICGLLPLLCGPLWGQDLSATYFADIPPADTVYTIETATRLSVCLNGKWQFQPAGEDRSQPPRAGWGSLAVPGVWSSDWQTPVREPGEKPVATWQLKGAVLAWYQRSVAPVAKPGASRYEIELCQVSGFAQVFVDGAVVGVVDWGGRVDVTTHVRPGRPFTLSVLVAAQRFTPGDRSIFEGPVAGRQGMPDRGIVGDVYLHALPAGPVIDHARIVTSVSDSSWSACCELRRLEPGQKYYVAVTATTAGGKPAATMRLPFMATAAEQSVDLQSRWRNPRLWELNDPYLYGCVVQLEREDRGLLDEYRSTFGFREFALDKEQFVLNGRRLRLRPNLYSGAWFFIPSMCPVLMRAQLAGLKHDGFNTVQYWPSDFRAALDHLAAEADRQGLLLIMPLESMTGAIEPFREGKPPATWRTKVERQVRLLGNHPSVVMWGVCPNTFGTPQFPFLTRDQPVNYKYLEPKREAARVALQEYRKADPTRPVMFHASDVGEVVGLNMYLNLMPLQEQRDFLSVWAAKKDYPLCMVECGIPFFTSTMRYRRSGFDPYVSAPFVTEAAAAFLGREAYRLERDEYVESIDRMFRGGEAYRSWHAGKEPTTEPNFTPVVAQFVRERWRAWRTWGITGGMLPWEYLMHAFDTGARNLPYDTTEVKVGPRAHPGCWPETVRRGLLVPWTVPDDPDAKIRYAKEYRAGGVAFREANQALLAYVGGPGEAHTSQAHNFRSGGELARDLITIYDGDDPAGMNTELSWTVDCGGQTLQSERRRLDLGCGAEQRVPLRLSLPDVTVRTQGTIRLSVDAKPADTYRFTVFPASAPTPTHRRVVVFDPMGKSAAMLRQAGVSFTDDAQTAGPAELLVIGREALSERRAAPLDLPVAVISGLNVIMLSQSPGFWEERAGWRTAWHVGRQFWFAHGTPELFSPLTDEDLRDWAGTGTLLPARYDYPAEVAGKFPPPQPVWHCGNHGSVASVALEKPHLGSFTPLLEGEMDLAYSPLLQLRHGAGSVFLVQLDLEDQVSVDPAAAELLKAILRLADAPPPPAAPGLRLFDSDADACLSYLREGGNVLVTTRSEAELQQIARSLGFELTVAAKHLRGGGTELPDWPELRGVSVSDLHWRGFLDVPVIVDLPGGQVACNGLLAKKQVGAGTLFFCQVDAKLFPTAERRLRRPRPEDLERDGDREDRTYFRLSRWRSERLVNQLKTNLGGGPVEADRQFLQLLRTPVTPTSVIDLTGPGWLVRHGEGEAEGWQRPGYDTTGWRPVSVPVQWEANAPWVHVGPCWFRRDFSLPAALRGRDLALRLRIVAEEEPYPFLNGVELAQCRETRASFGRERVFSVPQRLLTDSNTLVVQVLEFFGGGGLQAGPVQLEPPPPAVLYDPDCDYDDNLYRWYPW